MNGNKIAKIALIAGCTIIGVIAVWMIPAKLAEKNMKDVWIDREGDE